MDGGFGGPPDAVLGAVQVRNEVVVRHHGLIARVARRLAARLPPEVELDDLCGAGALGLIDAAERFDPARGAPFAAYAEIRIRGAMIDALRAWSPRRAEHAVACLAAQGGVDGWLPGAEPEREGLEAAWLRAERRERLRRALDGLEERPRVILALHFFEAFSLVEIAELLGVSVSGVSRTLGRALRALRATLLGESGHH